MARQIIGQTAWQPCEVTTNCEGEIPSQMELEMRENKELLEQDNIYQEHQEMKRKQFEFEQRQEQQEKLLQDNQRRIQEERQQRDQEHQDRINAQIRQTYQPTPFVIPEISSDPISPTIMSSSSILSSPSILSSSSILNSPSILSSPTILSSSLQDNIFGQSKGPVAYKFW